ncbi:hypothetical protein FHG64_14120 [Antarcticibacterium flavum]|uniref:Uncharacterized protein n=1 Tax=Antarcticibacterium flavum TaxID=2058175 RepID=A0A5B7X5H2_9FLAO|nr:MULTISPECIES: hypothetical protein [Antarcticibacterium]MCM4159955.1 hypothetical protein [Antarcticibacterium sp. W02-3]QCY70450.1 hypothetical protein FHG64_14120 [Antarcticibacterium flavum]
MFSIRSYYQILDLQTSNVNLLDLYTQLIDKQLLKEKETIKIISKKIEIREKIKHELDTCLEDNFISKRARLISTICSYTFPFLMETKYTVLRFSRINKWELTLDLEVKNIRNYYKILFDQTHSRGVTNLLLDQKRRVETALIETRS